MNPSKKDPSALSPEEKQNAENQINAALFDAEMGSHTFISDDLPPEIAEQFLANVKAFENQTDADKVSIGSLLGNPQYPKVEIFSDDEEINNAIEGILNKLQSNGILSSKPDHISSKAFYKFLTLEFMEKEILPPPPGGLFSFGYSDFYSDSPEDMQWLTETFLLSLFNLEHEFPKEILAKVMRLGKERVNKESGFEFILNWRQQFDKITPLAWEPLKPLYIKGNGFYFEFNVAYKAIYLDQREEEFSDRGILQLALEDKQWKIQGGTFPGFEL